MDNNSKKIRNHWFYIIERGLGLAGAFVFMLIFSIAPMSTAIQMLAEGGLLPFVFVFLFAAFMLMIAFGILIMYFRWRNCYFYMDAENIIIESGVLNKRKTVIPFEKINTVDIRRRLVHRLFNVSQLRIDTGSALAQHMSTPETSMLFSADMAESIKAYILEKCEKEEEELTKIGVSKVEIVADQKEYKAKFWELALYGLNRPILVTLVAFTLVAVFMFFPMLANIVLSVVSMFSPALADGVIVDDVPTEDALVSMADLFSTGDFIMVAVIVAVIAIIFMLASFVFLSFAFALIFVFNYFNFTVDRKGDNLSIKYGLLTSKSYTLPVRNVHAVVMKQNILCKILGYCTLEVVSIGYGDEENEVALLYPLIRRKKVNEFLGEFLPEFAVQSEIQKAPVRSLLFFGIWRVLALAIPFAVACIFLTDFIVPIVIVYCVIALWAFIRALFARAHSQLSFNDSVVTVSNGTFYRTITLIRQDCVQAVGTHGSVFKRAFNICDYRIDYHGPVTSNSVVADNLSPEFFDSLGDVVEE